MTVLSDEQLEAAYLEGVRVCAETTDDDGSGWDAAGLRAVEAAVRADQIKKDIELVLTAPVDFDRPAPRWQITAPLRAQLTEGNTDE